MTDAGLRELERRVETEGSTEARLELARALERAGRQDAALSALLPARDDADVRGQVGRLAGGIATPIRGEPRERWRHQVESGELVLLDATPLGVVCGLREQQRVLVLDPDRGTLRWQLRWRGEHHWPQVAESALLAWDPPSLGAYDLWTGRPLHRTSLPDAERVRASGSTLLARSKDLVRACAFPDPRRAPGPELWSSAVGLDDGPGDDPAACVLTCRGDLLLRSREPRRWWVLDASSGAVRGELEAEAVHADAAGLLVARGGELLALDDPLGPALWSRTGLLLAGLPGAVLVRWAEDSGRRRDTAFERASGRPLHDWHDPPSGPGRLVGDVLHADWDLAGQSDDPGHPVLAAWDPGGRRLWDRPKLGLPIPVAPGRLVALSLPREIVCLEERTE